MKKTTNMLIILLFSIFFVAIFYKQSIGLNLFLFNIVTLLLLTWLYKVFDFKNELHVAVGTGTLLTAVGVLFHASSFVITMNILSLILLFGVVNNRQLRLIGNVAISAISQFFMGVISFFRKDVAAETKSGKFRKVFRWIGLALIPLIVLIIFFQLYSASSSKFSSIFSFIGKFINDVFTFIFDNLNFSLLFLFIFGFMIASAYFMKTVKITAFHESATDALTRKKRTYKYYGKKMGLLNEFRIGIILFISLNVLLAVFNLIDIWYVWLNFEWDGELLKEFVHEGTYMLITTLIISVGLVLIFFRKNLNFFPKNRPLKLLANIWLIQNMVMTVSVLIRNIHYINYYNLAYLRIGVILFLAVVFFGLVTVFIKINKTKNFYYLFRVNMLFTYVALIVFSLVNWDVVIAKFNFSRADKAFVHLNFMANLSDKALPYLDNPKELAVIPESPVYKKIGKREYYMTQEDYLKTIEKKKQRFLERYPERSLLEWNYADCKAYRRLKE